MVGVAQFQIPQRQPVRSAIQAANAVPSAVSDRDSRRSKSVDRQELHTEYVQNRSPFRYD